VPLDWHDRVLTWVGGTDFAVGVLLLAGAKKA
jgi:hypothetical protein